MHLPLRSQAKVEAGRLVLETIEFDLVYELESSMDLFAARMESKGARRACPKRALFPRFRRAHRNPSPRQALTL